MDHPHEDIIKMLFMLLFGVFVAIVVALLYWFFILIFGSWDEFRCAEFGAVVVNNRCVDEYEYMKGGK